jgi:hypothetical protein
MYSMWPKVLTRVKKIPIWKPYFFKKLLWSHFWIVSQLTNFTPKHSELSIFCLFAHYVYMSGFYLYIIFPWLLILGLIFSWNLDENQSIFYLLCFMWPKVLTRVKKIPIWKPYFFKKLLWSHFWIVSQ